MPTRRTTASWLGLDYVLGAVGGRAASIAALVGASAIPAHADDVLNIHDAQLVTYQAAPTLIHDLAPRAGQRGVHLDGSMRAGGLMGGIIPGHSGSDLGFNSKRMLNGYVDLFTGAVQVTAVDLALPADPGGNWVIGRTYNNRQDDSGHHISQGPQGNNWAMANPEIELFEGATDDLDVLYVVGGADRYAAFKRIGVSDDEFQGINGATGVVQYEAGSTGEPDTYTLTQPDGTQLVFFGFDVDADVAAGQLWKKVGPGGATAYVGDSTTGSTAISSGFDGSGQVIEAFDSISNGGRRYTYTYSGGNLSTVKAEICSSGNWASPGTVTLVGDVVYAHYGAMESHGSDDDLKSVTVRQLVDIDETPDPDEYVYHTQTTYYRYWTGANASDLKMIVQTEGFRQADLAGNPFTMTDLVLKPYSSAYFEYDSSHRADSAIFNGECGCAGGANGEHLISYGTTGTEAAPYDAAWKRRAIIDQPDNLYVTVHFDETGQVVSEVKTEGSPSGTPTGTWATLAVRGTDALIDEIATPANITGYTHSTGALTRSTTDGLVRVVTREGSGSLKGFIESYEYKSGSTGTAYIERQVDYTPRDLSIGSATLSVPFVTAQRAVFTPERTASGANQVTSGDYDETTMTRGWWDEVTDTNIAYIRPKTITTTLPAVAPGENGENATHTRIAYVRENGYTAFVKAEDGIYDYLEYEDGLLVESIRDATLNATGVYDADPSGVFSITENGLGWGVTTTREHDWVGRVVRTTAPDGDVSEVFRTVLDDGRMVTVRVPLVTSGATYWGPASVSIADLSGHPVASMQVALSGGSTATEPREWIDRAEGDPLTVIMHGTVSRYSTAIYDAPAAMLLETRSYFDIPASGDGTAGTNYDATAYAYDDMGRRIRTVDPTGTITRAEYDALGRMVKTELGTDDTGDTGSTNFGTNNMVLVSETVYDSGNDGGNGYVTKTMAYVRNAADTLWVTRDTEYDHDVRGRTIFTQNPEAPHALVELDNLGRTLEVAQYGSASGLSASSDPSVDTTNRVSFSTMDYDARGRVWKRVRHEINQSTGASSDTLESLTWYDSVGRTVKVQGGQLAKTAYDRLGRTTDQYVLGKTDDSSYAHALDVTGDHVVEQVVTGYEDTDSNLVLLTAVVQRAHDDATTTGELDTNSNPLVLAAASLKGRAQITAMWYDELHRAVTHASYGTDGGTGTFNRTTESEPTHASSGVIVSATEYNDDGTVLESVDPEGIKTRFTYDDLGRQTAVVRNYVNGTPGTVTDDDDLYTWYEYEDGLRTMMVVDQDADGVKDLPDWGTGEAPEDAEDQVTLWIYGVTKGATASGYSEVASNRMVRAVVYPDSDNGATSGSDIDTSATNTVSFGYNAQGQMLRRQDQAGNVLETAYDDAGRMASSKVATLATGFDGSVRRVEQAYDGRGLVSTVTQYDAVGGGSGNETDQVEYTYDGWGNVTNIAQDHNSAVDSNAHDVAFAYAKAVPSGGRKTIRRSSMTFPTGYQAKYLVPGSGIESTLVRVDELEIGQANSFVTVATYEYLGASGLVGTTLPEPDVYSRRYDSSGDYTQLDQWNRPTTWTWTKDDTTDFDFYDVDIVYNDRGDILRTIDNIFLNPGGTISHYYDRAYALDDLGRVLGEERGNWNGTSINIIQEDRDWSLTAVGNWATRSYDLNGSGVDFAEDNTSPLSMHFNNANEWIYRYVTTGGSDIDPDYDANGNLIDDGESYYYAYDAWNRLTEVTDRVTDAVITEYRYNGLGHRITEGDGTDTVQLIYDDRWRLISRHDGTSYIEETLYHQAGLDGYGGASDVDSVVMRRTFLSTGTPQTEDERYYVLQNWRQDAAVIIDEAAVQIERAQFSPYGRVFGMPAGDTNFDGAVTNTDTNLISAWNALSYPYRAYADVDLDGDVDAADASAANATTIGWDVLSDIGSTIGYAGYVQDSFIPSLSHVRHRVYKSDLGRWVQRDPAGYVDGANLYEYVRSSPVGLRDPMGLASEPCEGNKYAPNRFDEPVGAAPIVRGYFFNLGRRFVPPYSAMQIEAQIGWMHQGLNMIGETTLLMYERDPASGIRVMTPRVSVRSQSARQVQCSSDGVPFLLPHGLTRPGYLTSEGWTLESDIWVSDERVVFIRSIPVLLATVSISGSVEHVGVKIDIDFEIPRGPTIGTEVGLKPGLRQKATTLATFAWYCYCTDDGDASIFQHPY